MKKSALNLVGVMPTKTAGNVQNIQEEIKISPKQEIQRTPRLKTQVNVSNLGAT